MKRGKTAMMDKQGYVKSDRISSIERVSISSIRDLPVLAVTTSEKMEQVTSRLNTSMPILLGRVDGLLYPVERPEPVAGMRAAGVAEIDAFVTQYDSMGDLLAEHVRRSICSASADPLRIRDMVKYLISSGMNELDACALLHLEVRPDLLAVASYEITDKAREVLLEFVDEVAQKFSCTVLPQYYIRRLAMLTDDHQIPAAQELCDITRGAIRGAHTLSWMHDMTVKTLCQRYAKRKNRFPVDARIVRIESPDNPDPSHVWNPSEHTKKRAAELIKDDFNLIYIPPHNKLSEMIFNKKTGRLFSVKEIRGANTLIDIPIENLDGLPSDIVRILKSGNTEVTRFLRLGKGWSTV